MRSIWSQALASTLAGSSSTPSRPSVGSTFTAKSGSTRKRSAPKPSSCLMPRSVYWPLRHMSHSPAAQSAHGTGSGRRTMPTTRSPGAKPLPAAPQHAAERFVAEDQPLAPGRRPAVVAGDDLAVGAADADRQRLDQQRPAVRRGLGPFVELHGSGRAGEDGNGLHDPSKNVSPSCGSAPGLW